MSEKPSSSSEQSQWRAPDSSDPPRRRPCGAAESQLWQPQVIASNGQLPALRVPSQIKYLYIWDNLKERVQYDIDDYRLGRANGRSATQFGRNIKQLYRFLKESTI